MEQNLETVLRGCPDLGVKRFLLRIWLLPLKRLMIPICQCRTQQICPIRQVPAPAVQDNRYVVISCFIDNVGDNFPCFEGKAKNKNSNLDVTVVER